jgi:hypothetical protein
VTAPRTFALRGNPARTESSRSPTCTHPSGSRLKARNHPVGLSFHDRTYTLPFTTTTQMPVYLCSEPDRTPRIFALLKASMTSGGNWALFGIAILRLHFSSRPQGATPQNHLEPNVWHLPTWVRPSAFFPRQLTSTRHRICLCALTVRVGYGEKPLTPWQFNGARPTDGFAERKRRLYHEGSVRCHLPASSVRRCSSKRRSQSRFYLPELRIAHDERTGRVRQFQSPLGRRSHHFLRRGSWGRRNGFLQHRRLQGLQLQRADVHANSDGLQLRLLGSVENHFSTPKARDARDAPERPSACQMRAPIRILLKPFRTGPSSWPSSKGFNEIFVGILARARRRYGVEIPACCCLSKPLSHSSVGGGQSAIVRVSASGESVAVLGSPHSGELSAAGGRVGCRDREHCRERARQERACAAWSRRSVAPKP